MNYSRISGVKASGHIAGHRSVSSTSGCYNIVIYIVHVHTIYLYEHVAIDVQSGIIACGALPTFDQPCAGRSI